MTAPLEVDHHLVTAGQVILADKDFAGQTFEEPVIGRSALGSADGETLLVQRCAVRW